MVNANKKIYYNIPLYVVIKNENIKVCYSEKQMVESVKVLQENTSLSFDYIAVFEICGSKNENAKELVCTKHGKDVIYNFDKDIKSESKAALIGKSRISKKKIAFKDLDDNKDKKVISLHTKHRYISEYK